MSLANDADGEKLSLKSFTNKFNNWFYIIDIIQIAVKNLTPFMIGLIFIILFQYFGDGTKEIDVPDLKIVTNDQSQIDTESAMDRPLYTLGSFLMTQDEELEKAKSVGFA